MPVSSKSDNAAALAKYNARYNNDAYRAVRDAVEGWFMNESNNDALDIVGLITDAALRKCGYSDYIGTCDTLISQASTKIASILDDVAIADDVPFPDDVADVIDAYLARFDDDALPDPVLEPENKALHSGVFEIGTNHVFVPRIANSYQRLNDAIFAYLRADQNTKSANVRVAPLKKDYEAFLTHAIETEDDFAELAALSNALLDARASSDRAYSEYTNALYVLTPFGIYERWIKYGSKAIAVVEFDGHSVVVMNWDDEYVLVSSTVGKKMREDWQVSKLHELHPHDVTGWNSDKWILLSEAIKRQSDDGIPF